MQGSSILGLKRKDREVKNTKNAGAFKRVGEELKRRRLSCLTKSSFNQRMDLLAALK